ncbi:hypothetical protein, partial [Nocardiopsis synnemataformans]|uniref:hypothetical protein n=1 Tax=Nocardiopsis synnemataformans TaxID=61305 RepID=UPI003EBB2938
AARATMASEEGTPSEDQIAEADAPAAEVAVREPEVETAPSRLTSDGYSHEQVTDRGTVPGELSEPDLLDLTDEDLEALAERRLDQQQETTTSPFTVDIDSALKDRLSRLLRKSKVSSGRQLTITAIVFEGLEKHRSGYSKLIAAWQAAQTPVDNGRLFSQPEHRRWSGRALSTGTATITIRPTVKQRELIERAVIVSGAKSRKEFIEAILDDILPNRPGRPRKY